VLGARLRRQAGRSREAVQAVLEIFPLAVFTPTRDGRTLVSRDVRPPADRPPRATIYTCTDDGKKPASSR